MIFLDFLDLNGLLISNNQTHMGIYYILETERFQILLFNKLISFSHNIQLAAQIKLQEA